MISSAIGRRKEYFIRDTELKGFWLRVQPSGTKTFGVHARLRRRGRVLKRTIGSEQRYSPKQARVIAKDWLAKFDRGIDPKHSACSPITFIELLEQYIASKNLKPITVYGYRYNFQHYLPPLDKRSIEETSTQDLVDWYKSGSGHSTGTERTFVVVKAVLDFACAAGYLEENPAHKAALLVNRKINPSKQQHLSQIYNQLPQFMNAFINSSVSKVMRDWIVLSLTTGLRRAESFTLKWDQVDFLKKRMTFPTNKSDRFLIVPMVGLTYDMLQSRFNDKNRDQTYVFSTKPNTPVNDARKALARICMEANIPPYSHHDFRRLFASVCHEIGVSELEIGKLLNHSPKTVTPVYINRSIEMAREKYQQVVDALDRKIPFDDPESDKPEYLLTGTNLMRHVFYGKVDPEPDPPTTKDELAEEQYKENEYWEG